MIEEPLGAHETDRSALRRSVTFVPAAAVLLAMGVGHHATTPTATAAAKVLPSPPASGEMGFVVTQFHPVFHNGGDRTDCPDGMMGTLKDSYLRTLPPGDRARLKKPENGNELDKLWKAYGMGSDGTTNICANMYEFLDRPATPLMKGKVSGASTLTTTPVTARQIPTPASTRTSPAPSAKRESTIRSGAPKDAAPWCGARTAMGRATFASATNRAPLARERSLDCAGLASFRSIASQGRLDC